MLLQGAHGELPVPRHRAGVRREHALEYLQEGGLAGSVFADEADLFPVVDAEGHPLEQGSIHESLAHVIQ